LQVPYKGAADALVALRGGHVTAMADYHRAWAEMVDAGQLRLSVYMARKPYAPLARSADAEGPRLRHRIQFAVRDSRVLKAWTRNRKNFARWLSQSHRMILLIKKLLERFDQDNMYMNGEDICEFARTNV
jgi:hypothetical protein